MKVHLKTSELFASLTSWEKITMAKKWLALTSLLVGLTPASAVGQNGLPKPPKHDVPFLLHANNLIETESSVATEYNTKKKPILPSCKPLVWGQYADGTSRICDSHKPPQSPSLEALRLWIKGRSSWNFATQKEKKGCPTVLPVCGSIRWNYLSYTCRRHSKKWRILPHPWQFEQSVLFYSVLALSHRGDLSTRCIALRWNSHARVAWPLRSWMFLICPRLPE